MPTTIVCPRCGRIGFVRYETVVKADRSYVDFVCGSCNHHWSVEEDTPKAPPKNPKN